MAVVSRPRRQIRLVGGGGNANANVNSRAVSLTIVPATTDTLICVSDVEGTAAITSISQTNVTWTQLDVVGNTPRVEVWIGRPTGAGAPGSTATISYNATNFGGATIGVFEGLLGQVLARATGASNTMAAFTAPRDNCLILFCIGQNTFGNYYIWFSGRNLENMLPSALSTVAQYAGAYWGVVAKGTVVSGVAQRSSANAGTLRSISLALI